MSTAEKGELTTWDTAFREGRASGLEEARGISYREAWLQASANTTQNARGEWVPAIPEPLYGLRKLRKQCSCGRKFWTSADYRGHYALSHILGIAKSPGQPASPEGPEG